MIYDCFFWHFSLRLTDECSSFTWELKAWTSQTTRWWRTWSRLIWVQHNANASTIQYQLVSCGSPASSWHFLNVKFTSTSDGVQLFLIQSAHAWSSLGRQAFDPYWKLWTAAIDFKHLEVSASISLLVFLCLFAESSFDNFINATSDTTESTLEICFILIHVVSFNFGIRLTNIRKTGWMEWCRK